MLTEIVNTYLPTILEVALVVTFGVFGIVMKNMASKYLDTDTKCSIAKTVVAFVEQVYQDLHGEEKLHKAMEQAAMMLTQKGLTFDENEMRVMLEAAVAEFNEAFKKKEGV